MNAIALSKQHRFFINVVNIRNKKKIKPSLFPAM